MPLRKKSESLHLKNSNNQTDDYHEIVSKFLEKAKLRQESYSDRSPNHRSQVKSNVVKILFSESDGPGIEEDKNQNEIKE